MGQIDSTLPVSNLKTMRAQIHESLFVERPVAGLAAAFGVLATPLAAIGLYGVMATRSRCARARSASGWPWEQSAGGPLDGPPGGRGARRDRHRDRAARGYGLGRLVESQLFGLPADPLTLAAATATLVVAALLAGYLPAPAPPASIR